MSKLLAVVIFALASCSSAQKAAENGALACAEKAVYADLIPTVESVLSSGIGNWKAQLDALASAFGKDALGCAVQAAESFFASTVTGANTGAAARAAEYLAEHYAP